MVDHSGCILRRTLPFGPASRPVGRGDSHRDKGFTLVELLVVIGIIALLISILLPALNSARRAATTLVCQSNMRTMMQGMQLYAGTYNNSIPGSPWTSGAHIRPASDLPTYAVQPGQVATVNDNSPAANAYGVTTAFDWQAPIAKVLKINFNEGGRLDDRKARFETLNALPLFTCPENELLMYEYPGSSPLGYPSSKLFKMTSYSSSIDFMLLRNGVKPGYSYTGGYVTRTEWNVPSSYSPKLNKIGDSSRKIFLAEGARFIDAGNTGSTTRIIADFDAGFVSQNGGLYSEQRGYCGTPTSFNRSRLLFGAYGTTGRGTATQSKFILAFARHGTRALGQPIGAYRMNVLFFDGHAETLPVIDAFNPRFWSPKGTEIQVDSGQVYDVVTRKYFPGRTPPFTYIVP